MSPQKKKKKKGNEKKRQAGWNKTEKRRAVSKVIAGTLEVSIVDALHGCRVIYRRAVNTIYTLCESLIIKYTLSEIPQLVKSYPITKTTVRFVVLDSIKF